ncbi:hypothetical protein ABT58_10785 [Photobacterium aphoticum]|uniref:Uncharacterized protein n=1 Tax=Photobacterium aphoticum TaxID=754436 RepID=A0A0J1GLW9_9GAMM|nr:hypothetical protein ABT58_10785 [Photobacterium aphoticum]
MNGRLWVKKVSFIEFVFKVLFLLVLFEISFLNEKYRNKGSSQDDDSDLNLSLMTFFLIKRQK